MPEDRRLVPGLTVEENVLLPVWSARLTDGDARLQRVYAAIPEVRELGRAVRCNCRVGSKSWLRSRAP